MSDKKTKNWKEIKEQFEKEAEELEETEGAESTSNDSDPKGLGNPSYEELEEQLTLAEQQALKHKEQMMRMAADLENVRRRSELEIEKALKFGLERFIQSLLPVMDSLEQALQSVNKDQNQSTYEGIELTLKLFADALQKQGVEILNPESMPFNPEEHEAMSIQEIPGVEPHTVVTVFQKGYKLNNRVIRPARVIVAK